MGEEGEEAWGKGRERKRDGERREGAVGGGRGGGERLLSLRIKGRIKGRRRTI